MKVRDFEVDLTIYRRPNAPSRPRTSVILPTYARADGMLKESIESVLAQSDADFELIVVDDGSRDATQDVLNEYLKADHRLSVLRYERNSGLPGLRVNQAAVRSLGRFIAYQFDDDLWTPHSLAYRTALLEGLSAPSVVYGTAEMSILGHELPSGLPRMLGCEFDYGRLMDGNYISNNSVLHHRELFDIAGMYDPHVLMRRFCDYDLWLRFSRIAEFHWVDQIVSRVRANLEGSLGKGIQLFWSRYRKGLTGPRNTALSPKRWLDYDVLSLDGYGNAFSNTERDNFWRTEVLPFVAAFHDHCSDAELAVVAGFRAEPVRVITSKPFYCNSIEVTLQNYASLEYQRSFFNVFTREAELSLLEEEAFDIAILYRTVDGGTSRVLDYWKREQCGKPVAYLMDDNMLSLHEYGSEFDNLAPGSPAHRAITHQIRHADACIGYSETIVDDLRALNPRTMRLNTSIAARHLGKRKDRRGDVLRIAVLSGHFRAGIFRQLWPALEAFARQHANTIEFHFWGLDPSELGPLACPVHFRPFTHDYARYIGALERECFDVVLMPLDGSTRSARSKSPVKLLEAAVAGAFCVFSDVEPYASLPDDCCVKVDNTVRAWHDALKSVLRMGTAGREALFERALHYVQQQYTCEAQFYDLLATLEGVGLHARVRDRSLLYVFHEAALGGATLELLHHARLLHSLGFTVAGLVSASPDYGAAFETLWNQFSDSAPLVAEHWRSGYSDGRRRPPCPQDWADGKRLAERCLQSGLSPALIHFGAYSPTISALAHELDVPAVASVHQFYQGANPEVRGFADAVHCSSLTHGLEWARHSRRPVRRIVCPVGREYFDLFDRNRERIARGGNSLRVLVSGTLQQRKNQLAAIEAVAALSAGGFDVSLDLIGYTELDPDYLAKCRQAIERHGLSDRVRLHGFIEDPSVFYEQADLLLIAATDESMPQTMLQAMACGVPVVSTRVGGVSEILRHRYTGHLARSADPESLVDAVREHLKLDVRQRLEIIDRAHRTLWLLGRPSYVRSELVNLYLEAFAVHDQHSKGARRAPVHAAYDHAVDIHQLRDSIQSAEEAHGRWCRVLASRTMCLSALALRHDETWTSVSAAYLPLKSYCSKHFKPGFRPRLRLSESLREVPYREYRIPFGMKSLVRIQLAVQPLLQARKGTVGVEIVTADDRILAHMHLPLSDIDGELPTSFALPYPLQDLAPGWLLRVFQREADIPVVVYEVFRRRFVIGQEQRIPFVRFE